MSRFVWAFLSFLLVLVVWLTSTAKPWLYGYPLRILEDLCQGRGLNELQNPVTTSIAIAQWSSSPVFAVTCFQWLCSMATVALIFVSLRHHWSALASRSVFAGALFMSSATSWSEYVGPDLSLLHLLQAASLTSLLLGSVPTLAMWTIALSVINPLSGLASFATLIFLSVVRREQIAPWVTGLGVFFSGITLLVWSPNRLALGLDEFSLWATLPVLTILLNTRLRRTRGPLYLILLSSALLTNQPEFASAVVLGDIFSLLLTDSEEKAQSRAVQTLLQLACISLFVLVILPGEQYLNRKILIPAQKKHLPLGQLFTPLNLESYLRKLGTKNSRAILPFSAFRAVDAECAISLKQVDNPVFSVVTLDDRPEDRTVSLLYALISGKRLDGWVRGESLDSAFLTCKVLKRNLLIEGPTLVVRDSDTARVSRESAPPVKQDSKHELELKALVAIPGLLQTLEQAPGASFVLKTDYGQYRLHFPDSPAQISLSYQESSITISDPSKPETGRTLRIEPLSLTLSPIPSETILPSRSLLNLGFSLRNDGETAISSGLIQRLRIDNNSSTSFGPYDQTIQDDFILFPGESIPMTLGVSTPAMEGHFTLKVSILTLDGSQIPLKPDKPIIFRAWRRLPSVRNWVEEP